MVSVTGVMRNSWSRLDDVIWEDDAVGGVIELLDRAKGLSREDFLVKLIANRVSSGLLSVMIFRLGCGL